jgi:hypothetical protein
VLKKIRFKVILTALALILLAGCTGIGPGTVTRDRFDYVNAISNSWKKQMLLNLVKVRYVDAPVFMEVASIISQYAVEGKINLGASWNDPVFGDSQIVGGSGKYTDRPTITYNPLVGEKFTRSLMTPIPVSGFLSLIQADYPADFMFRICVQTINGIDNRFGGKLMGRSAHPDFYRLIAAIRRIQKAGGLGMRVEPIGKKKATVMFFRKEHSDELAVELELVDQILGLDPEAREYYVAYGAYPANDKEVAILTRSMLQIIADLASYIDVPAKDVQEGRVAPSLVDENESGIPPLIRIRSDASRPDDAFVKVQYRGGWFYIDDRDLDSKRIFSFLMMLFSLTETGAQTGAPIVTVPTN